MASVYLMASKPDAYTREGLIVGNPEAVDNNYTPTSSYSRRLTLSATAAKKRLLTIVTDTEVDVLQTSDTQVVAGVPDPALTPSRIPTAGANGMTYACILHPSTTGVWVKTP